VNPGEEQHVISFGRGVRLMSEEYYIKELAPFGINTNRRFRCLCRAICCPLIFIGRHAFVDPAIFQICMKHLSMPGNKDFIAPDSYIKANADAHKKRIYTNKVDPRQIQKNWKETVRAIVDCRKIRGLDTPKITRTAIRTAAAELTRFVLTMIPSGEQEQANGKQQEADVS
jgi:hypothetical protein